MGKSLPGDTNSGATSFISIFSFGTLTSHLDCAVSVVMINDDFVIDVDKLSLIPVAKHNINMLRSLNGVLFPIAYSETFYAQLQTHSNDRIVRIVYYDDTAMGVVYFSKGNEERLVLMAIERVMHPWI